MLILFYKLPRSAHAGRLQYWPAVSYKCRSAWAESAGSVSPQHGCHQAWIPHLSTGSRMGLKGQDRVRNLLPDAHKLQRPLPPPPVPHTDVFKACNICRWSSHVCSWVHIKAFQRASFAASSSFSLPRLFSPSDTPQLAVRWSKAVDRGVCPLISKHSRGAYGENAAEYSLHCAAKLTPA